MKKTYAPAFIFLMILVSFSFLHFSIQNVTGEVYRGIDANYLQSLINEINMTNIKEHVKYFSSLGSRVSGYLGSYNASEYIYDYLRSLGLETKYEYYSLPVPVDYGAEIKVFTPSTGYEKTIKAYPLWPNGGVQTCPIPEDKISGPLIYGGDGSLSYFDGQEIKDSIVLLDFNSFYWKNALLLGARAVVFVEPYDTTRTIAQRLVLGIPFNFPRLYVSREDGEFLLSLINAGKPVYVTLSSNMRWEVKEERNVIAFLKGRSNVKTTIGLVSYFDSMSVVPSINPGASDALNAAILLEIARIFSKHPPANNILFVFVSGHYEGLAGSRNFIDKNFDLLGVNEDSEINLVMFASIDVSSESKSIAIRTGENLGTFYDYGRIKYFDRSYAWIRQKIYREYLPALQSVTNKKYSIVQLELQEVTYTPIPVVVDAEPFALATGGGGISFFTMNSMRVYALTPLDTEDRIKYENVEPQVEVILGITGSFACDNILITLAPSRFSYLGWGFTCLNASTWKYTPSTGWYENVSNVIVRVTSERLRAVQEIETLIPGATLFPSGFDVIEISDDSGNIRLIGLQPQVSYNVEAFKIDPETGEILLSNDMGGFRGSGQGGSFANPFQLYKPDITLRIPLFECGSIVLTKLLNPTTMEGFMSTDSSGAMIEIWDFRSHSPPAFYGLVIMSREDAMVFVPTNLPIQLMITLRGQLVSVVSNSSSREPMGRGYVLHKGECLFFDNTPFVLTEHLYWLVDSRLETLGSHGISYSQEALFFHNTAEKLLMEALSDLNNKSYSEAYEKIYQSHAFEITAYQATMRLFSDSISTGVFFFLLLMPFSYVLERLLLPQKELIKRIIVVLAIFAVFAGCFYIVHPGFHLANSVFMVIFGLSIAVLTMMSFAYTASSATSFIKEIKIGYLGAHFSEIERSSAVLAALSIGINNMRRHKVRTLLNLAVIIIIVFSLMSFTSLQIMPAINYESVEKVPPYQGILLKGDMPLQRISAVMPEIFSYSPDIRLSQRVWLYPPNLVLPISGPKGTYEINAILGLDYTEKDFTLINETVMQGRWLRPTDKYAALIPKTLVDETGIEYKEKTIEIWGIRFNIVGIFDPNIIDSIKDLDDNPINPIDMKYYLQYGQPIPLSSKYCIIIPAKIAKEMGGDVYSIVIKKKEDPEGFARHLALQMSGLSITIGKEDEISTLSAGSKVDVLGASLTFPLACIAMLILLSTLLGNIVERKREIFIYNTIGLAPSHIQNLFLAESIIYAIIGTVIGYSIGIYGTFILNFLGLLPVEFRPNYSSAWVMLTAVAGIIMVLLPSMYPIKIARKLATPTTIAKSWKIPTKPIGDMWSIPFPFRESAENVDGLFAFLWEYINYHKYERTGVFHAMQPSYEEFEEKNKHVKAIKFLTALIPWDVSPLQWTSIIATSTDKQLYTFEISIVREKGHLDIWEASNQVFLRRLREQFLIWRALPPQIKRKYVKKWREEISKTIKMEVQEC